MQVGDRSGAVSKDLATILACFLACYYDCSKMLYNKMYIILSFEVPDMSVECPSGNPECDQNVTA